MTSYVDYLRLALADKKERRYELICTGCCHVEDVEKECAKLTAQGIEYALTPVEDGFVQVLWIERR